MCSRLNSFHQHSSALHTKIDHNIVRPEILAFSNYYHNFLSYSLSCAHEQRRIKYRYEVQWGTVCQCVLNYFQCIWRCWFGNRRASEKNPLYHHSPTVPLRRPHPTWMSISNVQNVNSQLRTRQSQKEQWAEVGLHIDSKDAEVTCWGKLCTSFSHSGYRSY